MLQHNIGATTAHDRAPRCRSCVRQRLNQNHLLLQEGCDLRVRAALLSRGPPPAARPVHQLLQRRFCAVAVLPILLAVPRSGPRPRPRATVGWWLALPYRELQISTVPFIRRRCNKDDADSGRTVQNGCRCNQSCHAAILARPTQACSGSTDCYKPATLRQSAEDGCVCPRTIAL